MDLISAKDILLKEVQRAHQVVDNNMELPRVPKRQGDNRGKQTVDDLLKLFTIDDERFTLVAIYHDLGPKI